MKRVAPAVLLDFVTRACASLALAAPVTAVVAGSGIGSFPAGDRLLFEPGGMLLVEVVRSSWSLLPPLATSSLVTLGAGYAALVLPQAVLWTAVAEESPEPRAAFLGRTCARVPALFALAGLGFLAQVLALALGLATAGFLRGGASRNAMHADLGALLIAAVGVAVALLVGIVRDVASATLACGVAGSRAALHAALHCSLRAPGALIGRWLGPAVLGIGLVSAAALVVGSLDVGKPEAFRFVLVALVHQLVVLALSICRAVWFTGAVRVARAQLAGGSAARL
jgi:hypothetical protein